MDPLGKYGQNGPNSPPLPRPSPFPADAQRQSSQGLRSAFQGLRGFQVLGLGARDFLKGFSASEVFKGVWV